MASKIDPRPGLNVFVNENNTISIVQEDRLGNDDSIVVVHPDDVEKLCEMLRYERDSIPRSEEE